jgi:hypothetical protein
VFCDVFSSLTYTCTGTEGTYADKSVVESECLNSYSENAPTKTDIVFLSGMTFGDTDADTLANDPVSQEAAIGGMSLSLSGVPMDQITIQSISASTRRLRNSENKLHVSATGSAIVEFEITAVLEQLGLTANDAQQAYDSLVTQITVAVQNGQFVHNVKASGATLGVDTFGDSSVDPTSLVNTEYTRIPIITAVPSSSPSESPSGPSSNPSLAPTFAPSVAIEKQSSSSTSELSAGAAAGLSIAIIVVCCAAAGVFYYVYYGGRRSAEDEWSNLFSGKQSNHGVQKPSEKQEVVMEMTSSPVQSREPSLDTKY